MEQELEKELKSAKKYKTEYIRLKKRQEKEAELDYLATLRTNNDEGSPLQGSHNDFGNSEELEGEFRNMERRIELLKQEVGNKALIHIV